MHKSKTGMAITQTSSDHHIRVVQVRREMQAEIDGLQAELAAAREEIGRLREALARPAKLEEK